MSIIDSSQDEPLEPASAVWHVKRGDLFLRRPLVVGILNVTPDSFSDGGQFETVDRAVPRVERMIADGADVIDVGGESTRPQNASPVSIEEERRRVIPVVRALRASFPEVPISVDTTKSELADAALDAGADIINDVSGFRLDPRMGEIVARSGAGVIVMHSRGGVAEMGTYRHAVYEDVVGEVVGELTQSLAAARAIGIDAHAIVVDPGIGFAKRSNHSLRILHELDRIAALGYPVLVGVSRKRFLGELSGVDEPRDRVPGTIGANVAALMRGARLFRVHDVLPNRQALDVAWAILRAGGDGTRSSREIEGSGFRFPVPGSHRP